QPGDGTVGPPSQMLTDTGKINPPNKSVGFAGAHWIYAAMTDSRGVPWAAETKPSNSWRSSADEESDSGCHCTPTMNQLGSALSIASINPSGARAPLRRPLPKVRMP